MAEPHSFHLCNNVILTAYSWAFDKFERGIIGIVVTIVNAHRTPEALTVGIDEIPVFLNLMRDW
jgi:hypothetical protein